MKQTISLVTLVVADYDQAIDFYTNKLDFVLIQDTYQPEQNKRWVVVAPPQEDGPRGTSLLLAQAKNEQERQAIGQQTGGRVFLFLQTDHFWRDYESMQKRGIQFVRPPKVEPYGTVAVFEDLYGNLWDLIEVSE